MIKALYKIFKKEFWTSGLMLALSLYGRLVATVILGTIINSMTNLDLNNSVDFETVIYKAILFSVLELFLIFWS